MTSLDTTDSKEEGEIVWCKLYKSEYKNPRDITSFANVIIKYKNYRIYCDKLHLILQSKVFETMFLSSDK